MQLCQLGCKAPCLAQHVPVSSHLLLGWCANVSGVVPLTSVPSYRFGANDAAARATAATATATERMKEGMAGSLAAMKRLNLGFKRSSQQES